MGQKRRVLVISKHSLFREGLQRVLGELRDFQLLQTVQTLEEAATLVGGVRPDVIVFDGEEGPQASLNLAQLFELSPAQVVTLSLEDSKMTVFTRREVSKATVEDLLESIEKSGK